MPTYDYICKNPTCQHEWEEDQKINDEPKKQCPECSQETAQRQISCHAFILNGPRWARSAYT